jgi:polar amino acid transport system ATP-binding protein
MEPRILLLDEPTSALDPELVRDVLDTILMAASEGYTMVLVSHELDFVSKVANRVLFLENGRIAEDGSPEEIFNHPKNARTRSFLSRFYSAQIPEFTI